MKNAPSILVAPSTQTRGVEFFDYSMSLSDAYTQAVIAGGGLPWIVPCSDSRDLVAEWVRRSDGVMLTGGDDIQPSLYASNLPPKVRATLSEVDRKRDLFEMILIDEVFKQRKPLLAICRGHQILNVALGGTLHADIALQVKGTSNHSRSDLKDSMVHQIVIERDSLMAAAFGQEKADVNSSHHQAVNKIASLLRPTAFSPDGIIEALELKPEHASALPYLLAVQFHPERLYRKYPEFVPLFAGFVSACIMTGE